MPRAALQPRAAPPHHDAGRWAPLWIAALVVAGGALWMNRAPVGAPLALGEMASGKNGYTMMTTDGGNDEILVVIDSRAEMLMVYRVGARGGLELIEREALPDLFTRARARSRGRP